ncbi:uncharacterized protein LOC112544784 isoform X2 [Pelodiscus sinensis]|uniref:uncharacterized protein LOC112544784 isoform X2 n=1 Tax=Pelodiscus sinensis TaxID=13735 RepID=UPI003F6C2C42
MSKPTPAPTTKQRKAPQRMAEDSRCRNSKANERTENLRDMVPPSLSQVAKFSVTTSGKNLRTPEAPSTQDSEYLKDQLAGATAEMPETLPAKSQRKQSNQAPKCEEEGKIPQRAARRGRSKGAQDKLAIEGPEIAAIQSPLAQEQLSAHCPHPKRTGTSQRRRESAGCLGQTFSRYDSAVLCESSKMAAAALSMPSKDVALRIKERVKALRLKQEEITKAAAIINGFIDPFIRYLKEYPERPYFKEVTKLTTGSYYEFVKIDHPDEFDVMLALPVTCCVQCTEVDGYNGVYYKVTLPRKSRSFPTPFLEDGNTVSPVKILEEFRKHVSQFIASHYSERWEDRQWTQNFRTRRDTFLELCEWLAPALRRRDTRMRPAIPLQKRVAIALWKLSTPDSYRSVRNQFGVGRSTVGAVLIQVWHLSATAPEGEWGCEEGMGRPRDKGGAGRGEHAPHRRGRSVPAVLHTAGGLLPGVGRGALPGHECSQPPGRPTDWRFAVSLSAGGQGHQPGAAPQGGPPRRPGRRHLGIRCPRLPQLRGGHRRDAHPHPCPGTPGVSVREPQGVLLRDPESRV